MEKQVIFGVPRFLVSDCGREGSGGEAKAGPRDWKY